MASSYSTDLKLELMVTGENAGTWGDITNTNLNLLQQAISGYQEVSIAGGAQTTTLVMSNAAISNARNAVIKLTGTITGNQIVTIPDGIEKTYIVENGTTGAFTVQFKTVSGTGLTFSTTDKGIKIVYSNGTNVVDVNANLSGPTLASDLDVNGKSIISTSNGNITLAPNGTGDVYLDADTVRVGDSGAAATLTTNGAGNLTINTNSGSNSGAIVINQGTNGNISVTPNGTGNLVLDGLNWPQADGSNGQVLQTNGSGQLAFGTISSSPTALKSNITLKTAASVTAGKLASINSSGEIINLPTLNTYGTVRTNSTSLTTYYTQVSLDGSTAIRIVQSVPSSFVYRNTIHGSVISNSATPTNGTTVTNDINIGLNASQGTSAFAISNNSFMIIQYAVGTASSCCSSASRFYTSWYIVTVDASTGNVTKGSVVTNNPSYPSATSFQYYYAGQINKNIMINYASQAFPGGQVDRILTWTGTTVTSTTDTADVQFWYQANGVNSLLTTNNILCLGVPSTATWRTASWTSSPVAIGTKTDTTAVADYLSGGIWHKMEDFSATGGSYVLFTYTNTSGNYAYNTFSINQTTGALTSVEAASGVTATSRLGGGTAPIQYSKFKNSSSQVNNAGAYFNSIAWTNGVWQGVNANGYNTVPYYDQFRLNSGDLWYAFSADVSAFPTNIGYTVNAYSTETFNYIGVVETTTSSSPASIVTDGVAANFTSLTAGTVYYATTPFDGTVATSSASGILVGKAISSTQILMQRSNTQ
jgi:hypothetical protein